MSFIQPARIILVLLLSLTFAQARSQVICPPNIDFEHGNFSQWEFQTGSVTPTGEVQWNGFSQADGRHTLIPSTDNSNDEYGGFPVHCPNGSGYSVKLGNNQSGAQAEGISYTYEIPASSTSFSLIYHYAIIMQDPQHLPHEQPHFTARIIDVATGSALDCVSFDFTSSSSLPGFVQSTVSQQVFYKTWTPITVDLSSFAGKIIRLEFVTTDCSKGGHFGYAYVDVNSSCNGSIAGSVICQNNSSYSLTAPFGFQSYQWFSDNNFSSMIGDAQVLPLSPVPPAGTVYPVIVTPYPSYGCIDTLYATISTAAAPVANAGADKITCSNEPVQLGGPPTLGYSYAWTPIMNVANISQANPYTRGNIDTDTKFIIKTTDQTTGCSSFDTVLVQPIKVDTIMQVLGKTSYCAGENVNTLFSLNNTAFNIQWYKDNTPIPGATTSVYSPASTGNYWARLSINGCTDSTRIQRFSIGAFPQVNFSVNRNMQCADQPVVFTNQTTISPAEAMTYTWKFGDGSSQSTRDVTKTFPTGGPQTIWLVVSTVDQCIDSVDKEIVIMPNAIPAFTWDSICVNTPVSFSNNTNDNGATSVTYRWDFNNGNTSLLQQPNQLRFSRAGIYNVKLETVSPGCENAPMSIIKKVKVNEPTRANSTRDIRIVKSIPTIIEVPGADADKYVWTPQFQLNHYDIKSPVFNGTQDIRYQVQVTDIHNCVNNDILEVFIMEKGGIYMPSGFTPNRDGLNDIIKPYMAGMKTYKRFSIYNRHGQVVFSSSKEGEGWDGTYKGVILDAGVFVWTLEYTDADDKSRIAKGTVSLIR